MTLRQVLFETGPSETALSNANSGSSTSSIGSGGSTTFATAKKAHGNFGARFINSAGNNAFRRWLFDGGVTATQYQFSGVLTIPPTAPAANTAVASFVNSGGAARTSIQLNSNNDLMIAGSGSSNLTVLASALPAGTKVRISLQVTGGSATASTIVAKVYSGTTSWITQMGSTFTSSTWNTNTDQVVGVDLGVNTAVSNSIEVGWDDIQINNGSGSEINDYVSPLTTPVVTVTSTLPPSTIGGNNGQITISWPAVAGASSYEGFVGAGDIDSGFTATHPSITSPYTFIGLSAGQYTVAVRALVP